MKSLKLEDLAPLSGAAAAGLLMLTAVLFGSYDYFPSAQRTVEIFTTAAGRALAIGWIGILAGLAMVWFGGSVFSWLKQYESGSGRLAITAMAGGILTGGGLMVAYSIVYTAAGQVSRFGVIDASNAWTMYSVYTGVMGLVHALILMIGATGLVALRTKAFPAWFGWASLIIAVGMATPFDYIFEGVSMLWLVVASLWIFVRGARRAPQAPAAA